MCIFITVYLIYLYLIIYPITYYALSGRCEHYKCAMADSTHSVAILGRRYVLWHRMFHALR